MSTAPAAIPWYVHPAEAPEDWAWLADQGSAVSFAVVNVSNGPGSEDDPYYPDAVAALGSVRLVGYVPVTWGRRPVADVARDIEAWRRLYRVGGVMFDELPTSPGSLARCAEYAAAARAAGMELLVANPGVFPTPGHLEMFDVTCVFEGTVASYRDLVHPAWAQDVPASRLWHLVYGCGEDELDDVAALAAAHGAGHVFATDRVLPNPWGGLPRARRQEALDPA